MEQENVLNRISELLEPIVNTRKLYVVDITYNREGGTFVLRILLDKEGGITMDECAGLNSELADALDKENVIDGHYVIDVSSPGLDRKLKEDRDFVWAIGKHVRITTFVPIEGKGRFSGILRGLGNGAVVVDEDGVSTEIPREKIASAKLNEIEAYACPPRLHIGRRGTPRRY
ncbi:MAG: ribosome maturation factor RimP [Candidatus Omnitrophota bacterium]